jgi:hypothetical protein
MGGIAAEARPSELRALGLSSRTKPALLGLIAAILFVVDLGIAYTFLAQGRPGATDFYSRWVGARAVFQQGLSPYSDEVSRQIQAGIYGRPLRPGEDLYLFAYPFYTALLIAPLTLLPYPWAAAIWLVMLQASLAGALLLALDLYRWRPPPTLLGLLGLWTLLFYPHWRGLLLGQFVILVLLFLTLTLWALSHRRDGLGGVALALTTIKPQSVFLVIPLLLIWAISRRRWRFVGVFALTLGALLAASFLAQPGWLAGFLQQALAYPAYTAYPPYLLTSATWVLTHVALPMLGAPGEIGIILALLAGLVWAWWREARSGWASFHWTLGLTLVVSHLAVLRTATPNYVVFSLPLIPLFRYLYQRAGAFALVVVLLVLFLGFWLVFLVLGVGIGDLAVLIGMPLFMLLALVWGRRVLAQPLGDQR